MNVKLVVEQGARRRVMTLRPPAAMIGRAHGNTVRIPSAEVSRRHCRIRLEDGVVSVEDMDSVNGTYLNGRKIRRVEVVHPGDTLDVGPVRFVIEYDLTPEARARTAGDEVDMLELLADGEVDDLPALETAEDEEIPVLEAAEEELLPLPAVDDDLVPADLDLGDAEPWRMPEGNAFREMLSQLEDEGDTPTRHDRPKKKR